MSRSDSDIKLRHTGAQASSTTLTLPGKPAFWVMGAIVVALFFALHFWAFLFVGGFAAGWWAKGRNGQNR